MRYEFVGKKTRNVGKTLWEIVGNLKNFGVGRLVKRSSAAIYPELCFFKIVKVQPLPPPKNEFENRNVMVWVDEVYRDRKFKVQCINNIDNIAKFQLIPKEEEPIYLERLEKLKPPVKNIMKYCRWPPLYKKIWEDTNEGKNYESIPKLKSIYPEEEGFVVVEKEEEIEKPVCSLCEGPPTVDEMFKEIVQLKLLIKANKAA